MSEQDKDAAKDNTGNGTKDGDTKPDGNAEGKAEGNAEGNDDKKPDADKKADSKDDKKPEGAPESYQLEVKDGDYYSGDRLEQLKKDMKEAGLTNDEAKDHLAMLSGIVGEFQQVQMIQVEKIRKTWADELNADAEVGGNNLKQGEEYARQAVAKFGSEKFAKLLSETGFAGQPEVRRFLSNIGKAAANDKFLPAQGLSNSSTKKNPADTLWPDKA